MLIGLTGMYCAGKNHIAALLERRGFPVLDVDILGHIAIENKKADIIARFGEDMVSPDGSINRRLLGAKVFGKKTELAALEAIVHPEANRLTLEWVAAHGAAHHDTAYQDTARHGAICVINAALLHKSAVFTMLDCIIMVSAPWFIRLMRARRRDKLPWAAIIGRLLSQRKFIAQYSTGNADIYTVKNPGIEWKSLESRINTILSKIGSGNTTV